MYIVTSICSSILSQHALGDCTIKFESTSFRILLSAGYSNLEPFDAVEDAVSSQQSAVSSQQSAVSRLSQSQKSEGTKLRQNFMSWQLHCTTVHMQQVAQKTEVC